MAREPAGGVKTGARRPARPAGKPAGSATAPAATAPAAAAPAAPKKKTSPAQFVQEVRVETRKITWPSWKETWITSVMVFVMVAITSLFFLVTDGALGFLANQFLKLAG